MWVPFAIGHLLDLTPSPFLFLSIELYSFLFLLMLLDSSVFLARWAVQYWLVTWEVVLWYVLVSSAILVANVPKPECWCQDYQIKNCRNISGDQTPLFDISHRCSTLGSSSSHSTIVDVHWGRVPVSSGDRDHRVIGSSAATCSHTWCMDAHFPQVQYSQCSLTSEW
jgi:hypothetical protein